MFRFGCQDLSQSLDFLFRLSLLRVRDCCWIKTSKYWWDMSKGDMSKRLEKTSRWISHSHTILLPKLHLVHPYTHYMLQQKAHWRRWDKDFIWIPLPSYLCKFDSEFLFQSNPLFIIESCIRILRLNHCIGVISSTHVDSCVGRVVVVHVLSFHSCRFDEQVSLKWRIVDTRMLLLKFDSSFELFDQMFFFLQIRRCPVV